MTGNTLQTPFIEILDGLRAAGTQPVNKPHLKPFETELLKRIDQEILKGHDKSIKDTTHDHLDAYNRAAAYKDKESVIKSLQDMFDTLSPFIDRDDEIRGAIDGNMNLDWLRKDQRKTKLDAVDLVMMNISPVKAIDLIDTSRFTYQQYLEILAINLKFFDADEKKSQSCVDSLFKVAEKHLDGLIDKFSKDLKAQQSPKPNDDDKSEPLKEVSPTVEGIMAHTTDGSDKISASASSLVNDFSDNMILSDLGTQYQTALLEQNIIDATVAIKGMERVLKQRFPDQMTQN